MNLTPTLRHLTALALLAGLCNNAFAWDQAKAVEEGIKAISAGKDPIPGPRSCFWARGPASADPYINIAYPDAATFYWAAVFTIPEGAKLSLEGQYPHSRYMSLISYDEAGRPLESVADYLIKPKEGAINPFLTGADRTGSARSYSLNVIDAKPDPKQKTGMNLVGESRDSLHAPKYGKGPGQQTVLYRIYAADRGQDETGGVGLPTPVLTLADGKVLKGAEACPALRTRQPLQLDSAAMAVPMEKYQALLNAAAKRGPAAPATNPPTWYQQLDREALYAIYTGEPLKVDARRSEGGFYPNLDNQYIRTILNRKLGKVFVVRGKAPTTPKTLAGESKMGEGDLRYWSFCSNQGFANTRVNDCVQDENIPVGPDGYYTIVVSRAEDRPRNATPQCGVAWLPMADDGDGAGDADVTVLQLRHMLGTGQFQHAVQNVGKPGDEAKDMGEYYPRGRYLSTSAFETALPCLIEQR
ncbi:hypothetical protein [Aeromonas sp. BIGb0445]|uniref:hypothetical protein n=1 Tax=Aeromonas sp. BIGb0445 TaxID=2940593 RepID=UPI002167E879|nr:hypothetical protein [Aeromonas sp. BIGb0445]MCS3460042.1 hypothetical protein [Aeromonas sp. BIGb0445]